MAKRRVVDVGNCSPDHSAIKRLIESSFNAQVVQAHALDDTLELLAQANCDLVLVNRKLDGDYSDGMDIIRSLKSNNDYRHVPVMLVTNYEDQQDAAIELGALRGFGKLALSDSHTRARLQAVLG